MTQHYYNFAIIRYLPFIDRGEFINIGIIAHGSDKHFMARIIEPDYPRIHAFFPFLPSGVLTPQFEGLAVELARLKTLANNSDAEIQKRLFHHFIEPTEGVFICSKPGTLAAHSPSEALDELFNRYVHHDFKHAPAPAEKLTENVTWYSSARHPT